MTRKCSFIKMLTSQIKTILLFPVTGAEIEGGGLLQGTKWGHSLRVKCCLSYLVVLYKEAKHEFGGC